MKRSRSEFALHHVDPDLESTMLPEFLEAKDLRKFAQVSRKSRNTVQPALDLERRCDHETKGGLACNKGIFAGVFVSTECLRFCEVHFYRAVARLIDELASGLVLSSSRGELRCFLSKIILNGSIELDLFRRTLPDDLKEIAATWIIERSDAWPMPLNPEDTPDERWSWFVANFGDPNPDPGIFAHFRVTTVANGFELVPGIPFEFGMTQGFEDMSNELSARFRIER